MGKGQSARYFREGTPDRASPKISVFWCWSSHTSNRQPPHGQHEVFLEFSYPHLKPTATTWSERGEGQHVREGGRRAVAASSLPCDAWLGGAAPEAQAPLPWLRVAAFETRPPVAEFMPRPRGTALLARVPVVDSDHGRWEQRTRRVLPS